MDKEYGFVLSPPKKQTNKQKLKLTKAGVLPAMLSGTQLNEQNWSQAFIGAGKFKAHSHLIQITNCNKWRYAMLSSLVHLLTASQIP